MNTSLKSKKFSTSQDSNQQPLIISIDPLESNNYYNLLIVSSLFALRLISLIITSSKVNSTLPGNHEKLAPVCSLILQTVDQVRGSFKGGWPHMKNGLRFGNNSFLQKIFRASLI